VVDATDSTSIAASPDAIERLTALVLDSVTSPESKRIYGRGIGRFMAWLQSHGDATDFTATAVEAFQSNLIESGLSPSATNMYVTAIRRLVMKGAETGVFPSELASAIGRVKGVRRESVRIRNPLTMFELEKLMSTPNTGTLKGKRDRALLAVLIGCGLHREEIASLTIEHVQWQRSGWIIRDLTGRGQRVRSIGVPSWVKRAVDLWTIAAAIRTGRVFRAVNKGDRVSGDGITAQSVFETVKHYAARIGLDYVAPADLRLTYERMIRKDRVAFEQVRIS